MDEIKENASGETQENAKFAANQTETVKAETAQAEAAQTSNVQSETANAAIVQFETQPTDAAVMQTEGEAVKAVKHKKFKIMPLIAFVSNIFYLVVQVMVFIMFMTGMATLFGEGFTIVSCVNYVIAIFSVNLATAYNLVCGCVLTIIYIVFTVCMIKWLVASVKRLVMLIKITFTKPDENNPIKPPSYPLNIYYPCIRTFFLAFCFMALANLVSYNTLTDSAITCMVFAGICTVANTVIPQLTHFSKDSIVNLVLTTVKDVLGFTVICLLVTFINKNVVYDFINGFVMIFSGNMFGENAEAKAIIYMIYNNIVSPVLFVILAGQVLGLISKYLTYPAERKISGVIISQLIYAGVYMILHLVFKLILVSGSFDVSMIGDWLSIMKNDLVPIFLLMLTLVLIEVPFRKTQNV